MKLATCFLALCFWSAIAHAHLLPKQNATLNIVDSSAYLVLSVPVSALNGIDDDQNGLLSPQELQKHTVDIEQQVARRLQLSAEGMVGMPVLTMVTAPHTDGTIAESDYIIVMHRVNFPRVPDKPGITTDLFGRGPGEAQMTMTATYGKKAEIAILEAGSPGYIFFRGRWETFCHFTKLGAMHILGGLDHLLFLLTILLGGIGWRYWLAMVTSFTLAHSITLSLAVLNIVRLPSAVVEPGIAASIVLMAGVNLYRMRRTGPGPGVANQKLATSGIVLVFAFGLLHGLGFASGIGAIANDTVARLVTLAGFNLGVELGQFLFLASLVLLVKVLSKTGFIRHFAHLSKTVSTAAALFGIMLWLQQMQLLFGH